MGSNMAECHPVAFRWVMQAKTRTQNPCTVMHADPRFTRTSAMANIYAPVRAGSDIAFLGALIHYVLGKHERLVGKKREDLTDPRDRFFFDYLTRYTNALTLVNDEFEDTEKDLAGLFSGYDRDKRKYEPKSWRYATEGSAPVREGEPESFADRVGRLIGPRPKQAESLADEHCVFQVLKRHFARYTPQMVEDVCGTPRDVFLRVAEAVYNNAGPERTGAICYAVGWTQHTVGVQMIRTAAVLQLLLGNVGRPGGGILALRGHATIQGSTDIATLYNIHPGYLNTPSALSKHDTIVDYIETETSAGSYWSNMPAFLVSQLKAWYGEAATKENGYAYDFLPKIVGDHSHIPIFLQMDKGNIEGFFAMGQNPAVGGQNASFQRKALAKLKWLVVRDLYETETATFWKDSPEVKNGTLKPEQIDTEVFLLPAAAVAEGEGSFTNTQRLVQWHEKALDPPDDARTDLWFTVHLGLRLKEHYKHSEEKRDRPIRALVWDYIDENENAKWEIRNEPSARLVLKEINGFKIEPGVSLKDATALAALADIKDDGSTACGAWIYTGVFAPTKGEPPGLAAESAAVGGGEVFAATTAEPLGHNHAANRKGDGWVSPGWGFSWPANRRILYNRCSADPSGEPWPKEARLAREHFRAGGRDFRGYVYWQEDTDDPKKSRWVGLDVPDFVAGKAPNTPGKPDGVGLAGHDGASPFIMKADGKGWLYAPSGLVDGPMPTHYEPYESPVTNAVYPERQNNPVALNWEETALKHKLAPVGSEEFPHVLSTYRLTEHHLSGSMSRWLPWLAELMPELFCEISPEHAAQIGVRNTDVVKIVTPRGTIKAKALVTRRIRSFRLKGGVVVHHVGLPWHWGYKGISTGDVVNDLTALVGDPNVSIHEAKVFVCNVKKA
jgi:formate dehydrogenase major subunit